jgi:hypothetical protein
MWYLPVVVLLAFLLVPADKVVISPGKPWKLVHIPRAQARLVEQHLRTIVDNGWGEVMPGDLYHCHLLIRHGAGNIESLGDLFANVAMILYHSDEHTVRWRGEDGILPLSKRRPRSIVGFLDGTIVPAATLMRSDLSHYERDGSIHSDELAVEIPNLIEPRSDYRVKVLSRVCSFNLIVDIGLAHGDDPSISVKGDKLKVTMDCEQR